LPAWPQGARGGQRLRTEDHANPEQAKSVHELADRCSYVTVEERGASYLQVTTFDAEGAEIGGRRIFPDEGYGTKDLPGD
ncbi:MAG TPA: hypothetical protein VF431_07700, partial [Candidatus Methylomirabilis sp.]